MNEKVTAAALYGLRFAAEKERLSLLGCNPEWVAQVVATHAVNGAIAAGVMVNKDVHDKAVSDLRARASQFEKYWASAKVEADRQLERVQAALTDMEDSDLAAKLADQIGVILHREDRAA